MSADNAGSVVQFVTGPFLIGVLLNYGLLGILTLQVYSYAATFQNDTAVLRILAFSVFIIDILQTIFSTHYVWGILVSGWGDINHLIRPAWSMSTLSPMAGIVSFAAQCFYAWRIWALGSRRGAVISKVWVTIPTVILITVIALISCVMSFTYGITLHGLVVVEGRLTILQTTSITIWLSLGIICDIFITTVMVLQLRTSRNPDFKFINNVLHRAIRMAIETGTLTVLVAIAEIVLYMRNSIYFFALIIISGKVYSNSFTASLNSRAPLFGKSDNSDVQVFQFKGGNHHQFVFANETTRMESVIA